MRSKKIVELEKIVVSDEDTDKEYQMIADAYKMKLEDVKRFVPAEEITMDVAVGKAVELIKNNAEITEQKQTAKKTAAKRLRLKSPLTKRKRSKLIVRRFCYELSTYGCRADEPRRALV